MSDIPIPVQGTMSAGLITTPIWTQWLHAIAGIAGDIAAICGFIVGAHTVYRLLREKNGR
jgi:hypothetical protein